MSELYRIVNITDREGNIKQDCIDEIKSTHPNMSGTIINKGLLKAHICMDFMWDDSSGKMLETSSVEEYVEDGDKVKVVTRNSIYYLEKENN